MNNLLAVAPRAALPSIVKVLPTMSRELADYAGRWASPDASRVLNVPAAIVKEADARLDVLEALLAPVEQRAIVTWLDDLAKAALRYTPTDQAAVRPIVAAIVKVCRDLPHCAWTDESLCAFLASHRFWPTPSDLFQWQTFWVDKFKRERTQCRAIIDIAERAKERPEPYKKISPSAVALDEVSRLVSAVGVSATGKSANPPSAYSVRQKMPSHPVSQTLLLAAYEQDALKNPNQALREASRLRADRIRAALTANETQLTLESSENAAQARLARPP
jgi:hypothetical protein